MTGTILGAHEPGAALEPTAFDQGESRISAAFAPDEFKKLEQGAPSRKILEAITHINDLLLAPDGPNELFTDVAQVSAEAFDYPFVAIVLFDDDMRSIQVAGINNANINKLAQRQSYNIYRPKVELEELQGARWAKALLSGHIYVTQKPEELMSVFAPPARGRALVHRLGITTGIVVPLVVRATMVGGVIVGSNRADFRAGEQSDLLALAHHTAVAIEMGRLYDRAEGRTAMLRELHTLSQTITSILDLDKLYAEVARAAGRLLTIDFCTVNTLTSDKQGYRNNAAWGDGARAELSPGTRSIGIFTTETIRRTLEGEPIVIHDLDEYPLVKERLSHRQAGSLAVFPFKSGGKAAGFITVGRDERGEWSDADIELMRQLSDYVTVAFTNARLYAEAKRRAERMTTLHSTAQQLARIYDADLLFNELREAVQRTVDAPILQIALWRSDQEELEIVLDVVEGDPQKPRKQSGLGNDPASRAIRTGTTYQLDDLAYEPSADDTGGRGTHPLRPPARSILSVPLLSGNRAMGALTVESYRAYAYSEDDVQISQILASQAAVTLDNIRLLQAEAQRAAEQSALVKSAHAIALLDIDTVLQTIVDQASDIVKSSRASLRLYDEETQELYWAAGHNNSEEVKALRIPAGKGIIGQVFITGEPMMIKDLRTDSRPAFQQVNEAEEARSAIAVPLRGPNGNVGVLANTHHDAGIFSERDLEVLTTFADYATIALSNAHLYSSLEQREEERTRLLHQLLTSQEAERRRVAVDIHDGPLQSLGVNILAVDRVRKLVAVGNTGHGLDELVGLRETLAGVVQELRDVINDLRPVLLERQGLVVAAEAHLKRFTEQYNIESQLEDELNGERLPVPVEVVFYRLMQEALTNVRKHASAGSVWVKFSLERKMFRMSVTDNGRGFDPEAAVARSLARGHIGLHSMMERVDVIGGSMEIDSTMGSGSRVTFWAPVR